MPSPGSAGCSRPFVRQLALVLLLAAAARGAAAQASGSIRGLVHDSLGAGGALAGAEVEVLELGRRVRTDQAGRFRIDSVPAGRYTVSFSHPDLVAIGFHPPERVVELGAGIDVSLVLATPSAATILARLCPGRREGGTGVLLGRVTDPLTRGPAAGGEVRAEWTEAYLGPDGFAQRSRSTRAVVDGAGRYLLCGVPTDVLVGLSVRTVDAGGIPVAHEMGSRLVAVRDLVLARTDSAAPQTAAVAGAVRAEDGSPLAGALVTVVGLSRGARSDSAGRFMLGALPAGTLTLEARAIGHARGHVAVELAPGGRDSVAFSLSRLAVELPEVTVTARAAAERTGFEARRARGHGHFIGRADIQRRGTVRAEDLFKAVPGIKVEPVGGTDYRIVSTRAGAGFNAVCVPVVFIDGFRVPLDPEFGSSLPVLPEEIQGIEIYQNAGEAPPEFRVSGASCAVILVWTRRGGQ